MSKPQETQGETREALRALVETWRSESERHKQYGDCYRQGKGWGLSDCADELDAVLSTAEGSDAKLLQIAGLVNGYHNDGTRLTAAETLREIADVLGKPMESPSAHRERGEQE